MLEWVVFPCGAGSLVCSSWSCAGRCVSRPPPCPRRLRRAAPSGPRIRETGDGRPDVWRTYAIAGKVSSPRSRSTPTSTVGRMSSTSTTRARWSAGNRIEISMAGSISSSPSTAPPTSVCVRSRTWTTTAGPISSCSSATAVWSTRSGRPRSRTRPPPAVSVRTLASCPDGARASGPLTIRSWRTSPCRPTTEPAALRTVARFRFPARCRRSCPTSSLRPRPLHTARHPTSPCDHLPPRDCVRHAVRRRSD